MTPPKNTLEPKFWKNPPSKKKRAFKETPKTPILKSSPEKPLSKNFGEENFPYPKKFFGGF